MAATIGAPNRGTDGRATAALDLGQARGFVAGENHAQGIGSAVVDLIFSMAKREVTFFSGTAAISRL